MNATATTELSALVDRWTERGLITPEQARALRADAGISPQTVPGAAPVSAGAEAAAPTTRRAGGPSIVVEALGYLGGVIAVVALGLIIGNVWGSLSTVARISFAGAVCVILLAAGFAVPADRTDQASRLRAVLWAGSTVAASATASLVFAEGLDWRGESIGVAAGAITAAFAGVLWFLHGSPLLHALTLAALLGAAGTAAGLWFPDEVWGVGIAIWGVSLVWWILAYAGVIRTRTVGLFVASVGLTVGSGVLVNEGWSAYLAVATLVAIVVVAVLERSMVLLIAGALATFSVLPQTMALWFPGMLSAAIALLVAGLALVAIAVYVARGAGARGHGRHRSPTHRPAT